MNTSSQPLTLPSPHPPALFSPRSVFWRVNRERLMVLAGPRALLLELAHPLVAAGVAEHSDFRRDPLGRLFRTLDVMVALNFKPQSEAERAQQRTRQCHRPVRGQLAETVGPYLAGTPYRAADPLLKLWVLATLIDSTLLFYERLVAPLSAEEKEAYYADSQRLGEAFNLPRALMPPTYADFQTYMDAMLTSDALTVGPQARAVVAALFAPPLLGPGVRLASQVSIGLTPPRLREQFGLPWGAADERRLEWHCWLLRRLRPWILAWAPAGGR